MQFFLSEFGQSTDHLGFILLLLQQLVSLLDCHLVPTIVLFEDLSALYVIFQTKLIQTHLLISLPFHFGPMSFSSFLFCLQILSNAVDLFLQLHFFPHNHLLTFVPDAYVEVLMELLAWLFQQRLLMEFLQSFGLLLLLFLVLQLKFVQSFIFLD